MAGPLLSAAAAVLAWPAAALAGGITVQAAALESGDEGWLLDTSFQPDLGNTLIEAVEHGVALHFVIDVEMRRARWYWFDERAVDMQIPVRLTFNALTRQYRVMFGAGPLAQRFDDIRDAARAVGRVRGWKIAERAMLKAGASYQLAVRMRLDIAQLPRPFQVSALTNRDWALESEWLRQNVSV